MTSMNTLRLAVILFYALLCVGLALYDEPPDPGVREILALPPVDVFATDNAWIAFMGFSAPPGTSVYSYGARRTEEYLAIVRGEADRTLEQFFSPAEALPLQGEVPSVGARLLPYALEHAGEVAALVRDNGELLARYVRLWTLPRFVEPVDLGYDMPIPAFAPLRNVQRLLMLQLAVGAEQGAVGDALAELRRDAEFWRRVAGAQTSLVSKLIALAQLRADLLFAAELGETYALNAGERAMLADILRPFASGEASYAQTLRTEARYQLSGALRIIEGAPDTGHTVARLFHKKYATLNRLQAFSERVIALAEMTPREYAQTLEADGTGLEEFGRIGVPFLYNGIGEILAAISTSASYGTYIESGHKLEGFRRLARLKVLAKDEQVAADGMPTFLARHAAELGDPYTGGPMRWNPQQARIEFNDPGNRDTNGILLERLAPGAEG